MNTAELARRLDNIVRFGVIEQTDFTTDPIQPRVRVRTGEILTTWIPIATNRAGTDSEHDPVQISEEVILLSPSGELAQAVVVGKLFSADYPSPDLSPDNHRRKYRDGTTIDYDSASHQLSASFPDGAAIVYSAQASALQITLPGGGTTRLVSQGGITIVGDINHNGDFTSSGNTKIAGTADVAGVTTVGGLAMTGLASNVVTISGDIQQQGSQQVSGDVVAGGVSQINHAHGNVTSGPDQTSKPV